MQEALRASPGPDTWLVLKQATGLSEKSHFRTARGIFVCISPWNFPLAIFTGQIAAALAVGNVVLAKPAEQTPIIATRAVQLMREAGLPDYALQRLPGNGPTVGGPLTSDHAAILYQSAS